MFDRSNVPAILGGSPASPGGPPDWPQHDPAVEDAVRQALVDGSWGRYHGPHVAALTQALAEHHDCEHVMLCSSGTAAVELALRGAGIKSGDEVILAAYDFKGNFQDVLVVGGKPVLVDVRPENWNLDVDQLAAAIELHTKAIVVSHLHGGVVDMPGVMRIAREHQLTVIEDAAQMPGARIHGRIAGMWGDAGILSFGGSKLVSAGRGGALLTSRDDIAQRVRLYTQRGNDAYPLSELQAAVVLPQWTRLDAMNARRTAAVERLAELLAGVRGLTMFQNPPSGSQPGYYKVGFQYDSAEFRGLSRDAFAAAARAEGIALDQGFRALHTTHSSRRFRSAGDLSQATRADENVLTLHHPVLLESELELQRVASGIVKIQRHAAEIAVSHGPGAKMN
jgi:dTDP-4-amino-4,6-dideoxygalactose transaminase